jgi:hypothetical protein
MDHQIDLEKDDFQDIPEVVIKPVVKRPTKIILGLLLLTLAGATAFGISNKLKAVPITEKYQVDNVEISESPIPESTPEINPSQEGQEGQENFSPKTPDEDSLGETDTTGLPDKKAALVGLSDEVQLQLNNHFLSTRNYFLRKAYDQITKKGRNYEYYLLLDLKRIKKEFDSELLRNNEQSISGLGGEFGATAKQRERVRSLYGDLMGLILALDYIYALPDESIPDADALVTRVNTAKTTNNLIVLESEIIRTRHADLADHMEKARARQEADKALNEQRPELIESIKNEIKAGN